jgi:hypothetical protein
MYKTGNGHKDFNFWNISGTQNVIENMLIGDSEPTYKMDSAQHQSAFLLFGIKYIK